MVTNDKSRQTSFRYAAKQHLGGGRGEGGGGMDPKVVDFLHFGAQIGYPKPVWLELLGAVF